MTKRSFFICSILILLLFNVDLLIIYDYLYKYISSSYKVYNSTLLRSYELQGILLSGMISTTFKILLLSIEIESTNKVKYRI